jgi:Peptidase family M23
MCRCAALALALAGAAAAGAAPAVAAWRSPVPGAAVTRVFDLGSNPFEGGRHRGVDLAARHGDAVRAPCAGLVVVAGRVGTSGQVVTVRCGPWRVSHMPLARVAVRVGEAVGRGSPIGTAAPSRAHAGLHLGVRREGHRFGYVDPLRFLESVRHPPPLVPGPPRLGPAPRARAPVLRRTEFRSGPAGSKLAPTADSNPAPEPASYPGAAPWPAWLGLALVLGGLGVRWRGAARGRRTPVRESVEPVR